ncbi:hypothetical protein Tco_0623535, partial [Tanacetum coccineum]
RFVSSKEATQICGAVLPECLTSLVMKESKAYKTHLGYATGAVPPKESKPTQTDKEVVQCEGADAEMNDAQHGNENLETTQE